MAIQEIPNAPGTQSPASGSWPRYLNALVAAWLFISAFAWNHTVELRQDTWIVAVLMFIAALVAVTTPAFRWANAILAVWLFISTLAFPHMMVGTMWNNLIVSVVVFVISLVPSSASRGAVRGPSSRTT